jgi:hypothetical protein
VLSVRRQVRVVAFLVVEGEPLLGVPDGPGGLPLVEGGAGEQLVGLDVQLGVADPQHLLEELLRDVVAATELVDRRQPVQHERQLTRPPKKDTEVARAGVGGFDLGGGEPAGGDQGRAERHLGVQLRVVPVGALGEPLQHPEQGVKVLDGLAVGAAAKRRDDVRGALGNMCLRDSWTQFLFTLPSAVALINGLLGGVTVALAVTTAVLAGMGSGTVILAVHVAYQVRQFTRMKTTVGAPFPSPGDAQRESGAAPAGAVPADLDRHAAGGRDRWRTATCRIGAADEPWCVTIREGASRARDPRGNGGASSRWDEEGAGPARARLRQALAGPGRLQRR